MPAGPGWRLHHVRHPAVSSCRVLTGWHPLLPLVRHATALRAYGPTVGSGAAPAASAWELRMPGLRYVLTLSPEPARGFSGEGAALTALAARGALQDADEIARLLDYQPALGARRAGRADGPDGCAECARRSRAWRSPVGSGTTSPRRPTSSATSRTTPRASLSSTRASGRPRSWSRPGAVTVVDDRRADVVSGERTYRVRVRDDDTIACPCRWWTTHRGERGPCKHVVAVTLMWNRVLG